MAGRQLPASILVATDHSAGARRAVERAALLAAACGARLTVLHVLAGGAFGELRRWLGSESAPADTLLAEAETATSRLATEVAAAHGIAAEARVVVDRVASAIVACADRIEAGLIVVGAHGSGPLPRFGIGSTAERVLRLARRPLLLVRQHAHAAYRRVLVPVDFSDWSLPTLALARALAPGAHVLLLHAWSVPWEGKLELAGIDRQTIDRCRQAAAFEAAGGLDRLAAAAGLVPGGWSPVLAHGEPVAAILEHEERGDADLVALGKHGRDVLRELLLGSTTRRVLGESSEDVLVAQVPELPAPG